MSSPTVDYPKPRTLRHVELPDFCRPNVAEYFDMKCEICKTTSFKSLHDAKLHYLGEHGIQEGYIKCCNLKFMTQKEVNDHLCFHFNPEVFK